MRSFALEGALDRWEDLVLPLTGDRARRADDAAYRVACELFDLGRMNMYAEIEPEPTHEALKRVRDGFEAIGLVDVLEKKDIDLTTWV